MNNCGTSSEEIKWFCRIYLEFGSDKVSKNCYILPMNYEAILMTIYETLIDALALLSIRIIAVTWHEKWEIDIQERKQKKNDEAEII